MFQLHLYNFLQARSGGQAQCVYPAQQSSAKILRKADKSHSKIIMIALPKSDHHLDRNLKILGPYLKISDFH